MSRKVFPIISLVILLTLILAACGGDVPPPQVPELELEPPAEPGAAEPAPVQTVIVTVEVPVEGQPAAPAQPTGYGTIVQRVTSRGHLVCGGRTDLLGFGYLDDAGQNIGFDIDFCRAIAAAMFGDPDAVEVVNLTAAERGPALQTGEVDILSRNATWTTTRDAQWGNFTWVTFYDGQGYMVRADLGVSTLEELDGATVCVTTGTTTELNLADSFRQRGLDFDAVTFEDTASVYGAYEEGRCDAATSDVSQLAAVREGFENPDDHVILDVIISKEPLTPAVPHGDDQWFNLVKTIIWGLINAEELGVTQANVNDLVNDDNVEIRRLLGSEGSWGQQDLGLPQDAMVRVISAVGNYGEIYDRYFGAQGIAFTLDRGLNTLWTEGGILYAPPLR
jgi:general L-amino acid transport system substrate-binding protein